MSLIIVVKRFGPFRSPRFFLKFGIFQDGDKLKHLCGPEYSRMYITGRDGDVKAAFRRDLAQLRIVRFQGGEYPVKVLARFPDGKIDSFNSLMNAYPDSYNYQSKLTLWMYASLESQAEAVSFEVVDEKVKIPSFEFLQIGSESRIQMSAQVTAYIGLVKEAGTYKYYSEDAKFGDLSLSVDQNLETVLNSVFLDTVNILVEIE